MATPRSNSPVPAAPPDSGGNGSTNSIPASDPLGDALEQHAHDQIIRVQTGDAPAGGAIGVSDPLANLPWQRGLARHFDADGNPAPHPAGTGK